LCFLAQICDAEFKPDLTGKICQLVQRFSPEKRWQIDSLLQVRSSMPQQGSQRSMLRRHACLASPIQSPLGPVQCVMKLVRTVQACRRLHEAGCAASS